jgi:hypothetical protein
MKTIACFFTAVTVLLSAFALQPTAQPSQANPHEDIARHVKSLMTPRSH